MTTPSSGLPTWLQPITGPTGDTRTDQQLIGDFLAKYASKQTQRNWRLYVSHFTQWLKDSHNVGLRGAYPPHINAYNTYLVSNHFEGHPGRCTTICNNLPYDKTGSAYLGRRSAVASLFRFLVSEHIRPDNPCVSETFGRQKSSGQSRKGDKDILLPHEIQTYWEYATSMGPRLQLICGLPVGMALRAEECLSIRLENIEHYPRTSSAYVLRKGGNWEWVDIPAIFMPIITEYADGRTEGPLIRTEKRQRQSDGSFGYASLSYRQFLDITKKSGIESGVRADGAQKKLMHPHVGRHTQITLALTETHCAKGEDVPRTTELRVSKYAGHEDTRTTRLYYNNRRLTPGVLRNPLGIDWRHQAL